MGSRGHPRISIRIQEGGARGMDWVTTSDDLVITGGVGFGGDGDLNAEGRSCTAARLRSGSSPSRPDTDNMESGGCLTRYHPPLAPQCRPSCVLVGPSRPPSHGHRIPEHPLHSPLDPAGTPPPPQVPCEARRVPAPGDRSAGWRRAAAAREPPPPPQLRLRRTRPPRSVLAVPGRGQTRLPASRGGGDALGPSDRARPSTPGLGGGLERALLPGPRRSAPHPTPAPPPLPNTPSGARLTLRAPRGQERGAHCAGGRVGVAVALRRTTSGSARRFLFHSRVCCSSPRVEKKEERNLSCVWAPLGSGAQQGHPRAKRRGWRGGTNLARRGGPRGDLGQTNPK